MRPLHAQATVAAGRCASVARGLARVRWTGRGLATKVHEQEKRRREPDHHTHRSSTARLSAWGAP